MNEYIEKNALYKKIAELEELARNRYLDTPSNSPACARYMAQLDERTRFKHMIYDSPAADVEEVRCGRWEEVDWVEPDGHGFGTVRTPKAGLRCNQCSNVFKKELLWKRNYCPNCGAKMDLED